MENEIKAAQIATETGERTTALLETPPEGGLHILVNLYANVGGTEYVAYQYGIKQSHMQLALRLCAAWKAKALAPVLVIMPRAVGGFFVTSNHADMPLGRRLNADLKKVGF